MFVIWESHIMQTAFSTEKIRTDTDSILTLENKTQSGIISVTSSKYRNKRFYTHTHTHSLAWTRTEPKGGEKKLNYHKKEKYIRECGEHKSTPHVLCDRYWNWSHFIIVELMQYSYIRIRIRSLKFFTISKACSSFWLSKIRPDSEQAKC